MYKNNQPRAINRRECLAGIAAAGIALPVASLGMAAARQERLKVAAVITEFTYRSHAHVILENFLEPYLFNGRPTEAGMDIVSMYVDQFPEGDMARDVAKRYGFPIVPTIADALTVGGDELAVDAVLSIGEHGRYPVNDRWQTEYPRKRFFDEIVAVLQASDRSVPIFSDKHLSYRWDWAREMYDTSVRIGAPLMAGSSVPLAQRFPVMEIPTGAKMTEAVSIHGGGVESYDIHGLEVLQSLVEARAGGETGVASVQFLEGDALWQAADAGLWSTELAEAAMSAELGPGQAPLRKLVDEAIVGPRPPHGILVTYRDGFRAIMLTVGSSGMRWSFACRIEGEPQPRFCRFYVGPWQNRNLFKALSHAIQTHFREGEAPYPVERTLLTTGIVAAAMDSRFEGGESLDTPHLDMSYAAKDYRAMREMGASWKIISEDVPQPPGIVAGGTLTAS